MVDPQSENKLVRSAAAGLQIHSNVAFIPAERCRIYLTTSDLCKSMLDETGLANVSVKVSRCFVWGCSLYSVSAMESVFHSFKSPLVKRSRCTACVQPLEAPKRDWCTARACGNVINNMALDFWREGKDREELWMNSKELETKISQNIFNDKNSGFLHSSIIDHHLVDHYIPFLPLELRHVRQCAMAEMVHLNITRNTDLADKVAREMPFFPKEDKVFAVKGCKSVRQKLVLYADE
ncbi:Torsin-1A [Anabarilius grahami]|uniref:Torsin-1A n=1 Tax=Anabarilius grahami TaxID=495550 RepID=A0A3N0Z1F9_ANAGA|nr:Torsin-1A [Anabarilius grahami]